jgi:plasmid stability protein
MSSDFPSRGLDKFVLRLPDGMRDKIGVAARAHKRTMNAEIVQRLEASFAPINEPLFVINKNTAEADIIWELRDSMQSLQAEVADLRANLIKAIDDNADPETAGVPDFTDVKGMAILETRRIVGELLESVKAVIKFPSPDDGSKKD